MAANTADSGQSVPTRRATQKSGSSATGDMAGITVSTQHVKAVDVV